MRAMSLVDIMGILLIRILDIINQGIRQLTIVVEVEGVEFLEDGDLVMVYLL